MRIVASSTILAILLALASPAMAQMPVATDGIPAGQCLQAAPCQPVSTDDCKAIPVSPRPGTLAIWRGDRWCDTTASWKTEYPTPNGQAAVDHTEKKAHNHVEIPPDSYLSIGPTTTIIAPNDRAADQAVVDYAERMPAPDDAKTPGSVATTDRAEVCGSNGGMSYSKAHRHTSREMKDRVLAEYGMHRPFTGEIDHRVPLALGGADVLANLWPEPAPSYHEKDRLEEWAWGRVCRGTMPLADGQAIFLGDWRAGYQRAFGEAP